MIVDFENALAFNFPATTQKVDICYGDRAFCAIKDNMGRWHSWIESDDKRLYLTSFNNLKEFKEKLNTDVDIRYPLDLLTKCKLQPILDYFERIENEENEDSQCNYAGGIRTSNL